MKMKWWKTKGVVYGESMAGERKTKKWKSYYKVFSCIKRDYWKPTHMK